MPLSILRDIASNIQKGVFCIIMIDEVTDSSNQEQFVLCLRWVDVDLNPHEELIGLHVVPNICADTLVACIRNVLIRMNLALKKCRGQCYDDASNMSGAKYEMPTQIKAEEPRTIFSHCYGHSLKLAVGDLIKEVQILKDAFNTTSEISKLLKFSPKREALFKKLKEDVPKFLGFRTLCPTRPTVRGGVRVLLKIGMYCKNYGTSVWKLS